MIRRKRVGKIIIYLASRFIGAQQRQRIALLEAIIGETDKLADPGPAENHADQDPRAAGETLRHEKSRAPFGARRRRGSRTLRIELQERHGQRDMGIVKVHASPIGKVEHRIEDCA